MKDRQETGIQDVKERLNAEHWNWVMAEAR